MLRTLLACLAASGVALHVPKPPLLSHGSKCKSSRSGVRLASPLSGPEGLPLRPPSKLSGVVDDRVAALDRTPSFVEGIMISDVVTIGDTSDAPVIIGEELVAETAQESDNIAIAALLAVAVLWGTNFPAVRYLVTDPVSLTPAAYSFARFGASALALSPLLPRASSKGALLAGAECGLWIAAGYVVQCLALQGTTAAKGALLAALQVVVVPAVVVLFPALRPKEGKQPTMKDWVCAGAALSGVALLELQGLTAPVASDAALQRSATLPLSRPMTDTIPDGCASDAACIASPLSFVSLTPSANEIAPAKQRAEYSPNDKPIAQVAASTTSGDSARSFSTAAMDDTKMAGWLTAVESSSALGPSAHLANKS